MWGFLCRISALTICCSQDVGLANKPCRMVGGCLTTIQHQETIHMSVNKVYAVLAKKATLVIILLSVITTVLGLAALYKDGNFELKLDITSFNVKVTGKGSKP